MAGGLISVTSTVTFPAQPTTGSLRYIPLGGDGFSAPFAAYELSGHGVTGDASSGSASLIVKMDPRFTSLVSFASVGMVQPTATDRDIAMLLAGAGTQALQVAQVAVDALVDAATIRKSWVPVPVILPGGITSGSLVPQLTVKMLNVDTASYTLTTMIYVFNIRARELTPMGPLLWARGAS